MYKRDIFITFIIFLSIFLFLQTCLTNSSIPDLAANAKIKKAHDLYYEGINLCNEYKYEEAIEKLRNAAEIYNTYYLNNKFMLADIYYCSGLCYFNLNQYDLTIEYYDKALVILKEIGNNNDIAKCLYSIGLVYYNIELYDKALNNFIQAKNIAEELEKTNGIKKSLAIIIDYIGNVYKILGQYNESIKYYQKSLNINKEIGNKAGIAGGLHESDVLPSATLPG